MPLLTGGSGIALGLGHNFAVDRAIGGAGSAFKEVHGPEAILAGICSKATLGQIEYHKTRHPVLPIGVENVMSGQLTPDQVIEFLLGLRDKAHLPIRPTRRRR